MRIPPSAVIVRRLDALSSRRALVLPLFALLAIWFTSPLWAKPMNLGHGDWLWFHFTWDSARRTLLEFRGLPWWNPYYCGGNLGIANPQSLALSPLYLLLLPLQTAPAMKAYLGLSTFLGLWGTYELCRRNFGRGPFTVIAAVTFACSGTLGWHMNGQTAMCAFHLLPWVLYGFFRGAEPGQGRWSLLGGGAMATMVLSGGVYPTLVSGVTVTVTFLLAALVGWRGTTARDLFRSAAVVAIAFASYAAIKLVPVAEFLRDHRRPIAADDAIALRLVPQMLLEKRTTETQIWPHVGYAYAWWGEYGNYVGWGGIALGLVAIAFAGRRGRVPLFAGLFAFGVLLGEHGKLAPYALLRALPLLGNFRVPTRYWVVVDLWVACLVAAAGFRALRVRPSLRSVVLPALLGLGAWVSVDMIRTNGVAVYRAAMPTPPAPAAVKGAPLRMTGFAAWEMYRLPSQNLGTLRCWDEMSVGSAPGLRVGLPSEVSLSDPTAGSVSFVRWAPSEWRVRVEATRPATVVFNQNHYRGFRSDVGVVVARDGLVAVDVPAGSYTMTVRYRPPFFAVGVLWTLLALAGTGALLWRTARSRDEHAPRDDGVRADA